MVERDQVVCPCLDISAGQIMDAYEEGATTATAIQEITDAGTICGACLDQIEELLGELKG